MQWNPELTRVVYGSLNFSWRRTAIVKPSLRFIELASAFLLKATTYKLKHILNSVQMFFSERNSHC